MSIFLSLLLTFFTIHAAPGSSQSTSKPWAYITEGVGIAGIQIDKSTAADVVAAFGRKYTVFTHREYSRSIEYSDLGLSFYYCLNDKQKKIFLVEVHQGTTSKGIIVGRSTLKDVFDVYGKEDEKTCGSPTSCVYEYKGLQFYVEGPNDSEDESVDRRLMKVVEIDVMAPDKSCNFCDEIDKSVDANDENSDVR